MPTKFVILSAARSGTTLLTATLRTHPDILCHGEIFHPKYRQHLKGTFTDMPDAEIVALRDDLGRFLPQVFEQPGVSIVGFKMWEPQNTECCARLLADTSVKKIIYERDNKLAQFSSGQLARQTGVWNIKGQGTWNAEAEHNRGNADASPLPFNATAFTRFLENQSNTFRSYRERARGEVMDLTFNQVARGELASVLDFLGATQAELAPRTKRIHSNDILSRYDTENHTKILKLLDKLGHTEWVSE